MVPGTVRMPLSSREGEVAKADGDNTTPSTTVGTNNSTHWPAMSSKMEESFFEVIGNQDDDWTLVEGGDLKGLQSFFRSGALVSLSSELTVDADRWRGESSDGGGGGGTTATTSSSSSGGGGGGMPSLEAHSQTLRELNLHKNRYIKTLHPSVCKLIQLERLTLTRCDQLTTLPDQIGQLKNLRVLDLTDASEIVTLPDSIGELQK